MTINNNSFIQFIILKVDKKTKKWKYTTSAIKGRNYNTQILLYCDKVLILGFTEDNIKKLINMFIGSFPKIVKRIKEYWLLITIIISILSSIFYMAVFQVTPWDKYHEIKHRREQIKFHNSIGLTLLEKGNYKLAKTEFENAINLKATDYEALNGRYLSELFLAMESPDWDASVGLSFQNHLKKLGIIEQKKLQHIVEKYLGDLYLYINRTDLAQKCYENAISLKANYLDALDSNGWFNYSCLDYPDFEKMEYFFRKMIEVNPFDYRGFHGLGYALYIQAINEPDDQNRKVLISEAADTSIKACHMQINRINIVIDLGEIARSVDPLTSIWYHKHSLKIINDPVLSRLKANQLYFGIELLISQGKIYLKDENQLRAWTYYQLALDHLVLYRYGFNPKENKEEHDNLLKKAQKLDRVPDMFTDHHSYPIYKDQLAVLDILLSDVSKN